MKSSLRVALPSAWLASLSLAVSCAAATIPRQMPATPTAPATPW